MTVSSLRHPAWDLTALHIAAPHGPGRVALLQLPSSAGTFRLLGTICGLEPLFLILSIAYIFSTSIFSHIRAGPSCARHSRLTLCLCSFLVSFPQELCGDPAYASWSFPPHEKQPGRRPKKRAHFRFRKEWGCAVCQSWCSGTCGALLEGCFFSLGLQGETNGKLAPNARPLLTPPSLVCRLVCGFSKTLALPSPSQTYSSAPTDRSF